MCNSHHPYWRRSRGGCWNVVWLFSSPLLPILILIFILILILSSRHLNTLSIHYHTTPGRQSYRVVHRCVWRRSEEKKERKKKNWWELFPLRFPINIFVYVHTYIFKHPRLLQKLIKIIEQWYRVLGIINISFGCFSLEI